MLPLNYIYSQLTREERNRLNENWDIITNGINSIQKQLNFIVGGEADRIIKDIEDALTASDANAERLVELLAEVSGKVSEANIAIGKANTATSQANTATDAANAATTNTNTAIENANAATSRTNTAIDAAFSAANSANSATETVNVKIAEITEAINSVTTTLNDAISKLSTFNTDSEKALTDFETESTEAIGKVNAAAQNADNAASEAREVIVDLEGYNEAIQPFSLNTTFKKHQAARNNGSTYRAKVETTGNPLPVSPAVENEWWTLEAQRGVDGVGAVQSVNGIMPGTDGNIELPDTQEVSKLVSHQFVVRPTTNGQTTIEIPLGTFDSSTDTLILFKNTTAQSPEVYSVSGKTITLVEPVSNASTTVFHILVMKTILTGVITSEIQSILDSYTDQILEMEQRITSELNSTVELEVESAVSALVNNSPATLDTINELAEALGDDPNFSTTIMQMLGEKASNVALGQTNDSLTQTNNNLTALGNRVTTHLDQSGRKTYVLFSGALTTGSATLTLPSGFTSLTDFDEILVLGTLDTSSPSTWRHFTEIVSMKSADMINFSINNEVLLTDGESAKNWLHGALVKTDNTINVVYSRKYANNTTNEVLTNAISGVVGVKYG